MSFLYFENDEFCGMAFSEYANTQLVFSDPGSNLNMMGWYKIPVGDIAIWDNEILKIGKTKFKFIMTPHVHHWDSMTLFEENTTSLFTSDLLIQPGKNTLFYPKTL